VVILRNRDLTVDLSLEFGDKLAAGRLDVLALASDDHRQGAILGLAQLNRRLRIRCNLECVLTKARQQYLVATLLLLSESAKTLTVRRSGSHIASKLEALNKCFSIAGENAIPE